MCLSGPILQRSLRAANLFGNSLLLFMMLIGRQSVWCDYLYYCPKSFGVCIVVWAAIIYFSGDFLVDSWNFGNDMETSVQKCLINSIDMK